MGRKDGREKERGNWKERERTGVRYAKEEKERKEKEDEGTIQDGMKRRRECRKLKDIRGRKIHAKEDTWEGEDRQLMGREYREDKREEAGGMVISHVGHNFHSCAAPACLPVCLMLPVRGASCSPHLCAAASSCSISISAS